MNLFESQGFQPRIGKHPSFQEGESVELCEFIENILTFFAMEHNVEADISYNLNPNRKTLTLFCGNGTVLLSADDFLSRYCKAPVYTSCSEENSATRLATKSAMTLKNKAVSLFMSALPRMLPNLVSAEELSDLDKEILSLLSKEQNNDAIEKIKEWVIEQDFLGKMLKETFGNYLRSSSDARKRQIEEYITECRETIQTSQDFITATLKNIREAEEAIREQSLLLDNVAAISLDEANKMTEFCRNIEGVHFEMKDSGELYVSLRQPLDSVDPSLLDYLLKSSSHRMFPIRYSAAMWKRLYKALWQTKKVQLFTWCAFEVDGLICKATSADSCFYNGDANAMPHPHLVEYRCAGGFVESFTEIAQKGDFYSMVMTMIASAKSFNLGDSIVSGQFASHIFSSSKKLFLYKGKYYSIDEILTLLMEEENAENPNV